MKLRALLLAITLLFSLPASAAVTVLVHGFLGSERSWLESGVIEALDRHGHFLAGSYHPSPEGVRRVALGQGGDKPLYTVNLPSTAPIRLQADWLAAYLEDIRRHHPGAPLILVGHSAGGVVARATLAIHRPPGVTRLITIAAPHLGTWRSLQALDAIDDGDLFFIPFGHLKRWMVKRRLGGWLYYTLKAARGVLHDLRPAVPGSFLYWLNQRPHPDIDYVSIIRAGTFRIPGDRIVPPYSQDMRLVPAIGERARSYLTYQGHQLGPRDGAVLAWQLEHPPATKQAVERAAAAPASRFSRASPPPAPVPPGRRE